MTRIALSVAALLAVASPASAQYGSPQSVGLPPVPPKSPPVGVPPTPTKATPQSVGYAPAYGSSQYSQGYYGAVYQYAQAEPVYAYAAPQYSAGYSAYQQGSVGVGAATTGIPTWKIRGKHVKIHKVGVGNAQVNMDIVSDKRVKIKRSFQ